MAYTESNYQTKKELMADFKAGKTIKVYQPGPFPMLPNGKCYLEGPHYPKAHKWYAEAEIIDNMIVKLK